MIRVPAVIAPSDDPSLMNDNTADGNFTRISSLSCKLYGFLHEPLIIGKLYAVCHLFFIICKHMG